MTASAASADSQPLADSLADLRPHLVRFARLQLRDDALAEDAVSDTVLAVLSQPDRFAGQSAFKTYVIGILKHKIVDLIRGRSREVRLSHAGNEDDAASDAEMIDALFTKNGHFQHPPSDWGDPDAALSRREFFEILQWCVERLPPKIGRIFMMREWLELETDEVCQELAITPTHAWVLLYRARMRLRECLELHWFGGKARPATPS